MKPEQIPDEAIDAAAQSLYNQLGLPFLWRDATEEMKQTHRAKARAAIMAVLEAWPGKVKAEHITGSTYRAETINYDKSFVADCIILPLGEAR